MSSSDGGPIGIRTTGTLNTSTCLINFNRPLGIELKASLGLGPSRRESQLEALPGLGPYKGASQPGVFAAPLSSSDVASLDTSAGIINFNRPLGLELKASEALGPSKRASQLGVFDAAVSLPGESVAVELDVDTWSVLWIRIQIQSGSTQISIG